MEAFPVFSGISTDDFNHMHTCFNMQTKNFSKDDTLLLGHTESENVCVLQKGTAGIVWFDENGNRMILEQLTEGSIFGGLFSYAEDTYIVFSSDCIVLYIDYARLIRQCENACECHSRLVSNVLQLISRRTRELSSKINILSQRTTRGKLTAYFSLLQGRQKRRHIVLPQTLSDLADYLCVDRSAMFREIKKMKEEGLLISKGRNFTLLY